MALSNLPGWMGREKATAPAASGAADKPEGNPAVCGTWDK